MIEALLFGGILAFGLIMPLGVQNIFIFNQGATQKHFYHALPSVITAALCDSTLILLAIGGVSAVVFELPWVKIAIYVMGFCFLSYMGWITWHYKPKKLKEGHKPYKAKKQIAFAASVSLLNPHAYVDTIGVIGTNSLNFDGNEKIAYTFACIGVSVLWFCCLAVAGHYLHKLDKKGAGLALLNKLSALISWGVALYLGRCLMAWAGFI